VPYLGGCTQRLGARFDVVVIGAVEVEKLSWDSCEGGRCAISYWLKCSRLSLAFMVHRRALSD